MQFPNRKDLFNIGRRAIVTTPGTRINPKVVDVDGSTTNIVVASASLIGEEVISQLATGMQGLYSEVAEGDALDRLAADRYGLTRFSTTPAIATVTFAFPGVSVAGTITAGTRVQSSTEVQFATDADVVFAGAISTEAHDVTVTALVAGPDSNLGAGQLTKIVDAIFDPTITVNNAAGAVGGQDAETDVAFRGRIRNFFPTARRGVLGAIEYGALQVPQCAVAKAIEIVNSAGLPVGLVQLTIADASGNANPTLVQLVANELVDYRASGIPVQVIGGTLVTPSPQVQWHVAFQSGYDQVLAAAQLRAVTVAVAQYLGPGATLFTSSLIAAAKTVPGVIISSNSLVLPIGDVIPSDISMIIRIDPTAVSFV